MTKTDAYLTPQDPEEITRLFFNIAQYYTTSIDNIKANNNSIDENKDVRIVVFTTMREVVNSSLLSSVFLKDHLTDKDWWKSNKNFTLPSVNADKYVEERIYFYEVDLSTNFLMLSFTHLETSLRGLVKAIPNTIYPDATQDFWKIRNYLIDHTQLNKDYKELLNIFQSIRNSSHNGGFHSGDTMTITYKSKSFLFEKGKPITFDLWTSIEFILLEVNQFLFDLVTSNTINNIPFVSHPFGTINFIKLRH